MKAVTSALPFELPEDEELLWCIKKVPGMDICQGGAVDSFGLAVDGALFVAEPIVGWSGICLCRPFADSVSHPCVGCHSGVQA